MSASVTSSRPRWIRTRNPFVWNPTNYFLYDVFDQGWYEFQIKYWRLCFGFCKMEVADSVSRDFDFSKIVRYHAVAIQNSERKKFHNSASYFFLWWRLRRCFKMVKRNISFYERKKLLQKYELCAKGRVHIMNFSYKGNFDIMDFWVYKGNIFQSRKLVERPFLSIYETSMIF